MTFLGNLIWILFGGGLIICLEYLVAGIALCLTIIGIPFGVQCFKLASLALTPFGRHVIHDPHSGTSSLLFNIVWLIIAGIWIALSHLCFAFLCAITVIGIPFAVQHLKLAALGLWPFGKRVLG